MTWAEHVAAQKAAEAAEEAAHELRMKQHRENIAALKTKYAQLQNTVAALECKLSQKKNVTVIKAATDDVEKPHDKILFLPKGRLRHCEHPDMDFVVSDRTAALLNLFAVGIFDDGFTPWLDEMHDHKTRIFDISKFEFEDAGVFAHGRYTSRGRDLYDAGRICGVSVTTFLVDDKPMPAFECTVKPSAPLPKMLSTMENMSCMGGVLIDGQKSAIQPYETPDEKWQGMIEATPNFSPELTTSTEEKKHEELQTNQTSRQP